jgi:hypothetical protein
MRGKDSPSDTLLDKRVIERNIKKGLVSRETFEKHLTALPDVADQAETIQARLGDDDDLDDDEDMDSDGAEESDEAES